MSIRQRKSWLVLMLAMCLVFSAAGGKTLAEETYLTETFEVSEAIQAAADGAKAEDLLDGYVSGLFYPRRRSVGLLGKALTGADAILYTTLRERVELVASGAEVSTQVTMTPADFGVEKTEFTAEELGVETIVANGAITQEAISALREKMNEAVSFSASDVFSRLLGDCPYELYWFDKTAENAFTYGHQDKMSGNSKVLRSSRVYTFTLAVNPAYVGTEENTVDAQAAATAVAAADNARRIVEEHAGESDPDKLRSYFDEIRDLADYNYDAALNHMTGDINPWQLVWVFDGDHDTKVVCEGYAKSYQYLCMLSSFRTPVGCVCVYGDMYAEHDPNPQSHMWNIVTMADGKHYLVDVTNCDDAIGSPDHLFMKGYTERWVEEETKSYTDGVDTWDVTEEKTCYRYSCPNTSAVYRYDVDMPGLYGEVLDVSEEDFDPSALPDPREALYEYETTDSGVTVMRYTGDEEDVEIPATLGGTKVTGIAAGAFSGVSGAASITVPADVVLIEGGAFEGCTDLAAIEVEAGSHTYTSVDGVLLSADQSVLAAYPQARPGTDYILPAEVETIARRAFSGSALKHLALPGGLKTVEEEAFLDCTELENLALPESVQVLGQGAFRNCQGLTEAALPSGLREAGSDLFAQCDSLVQLVIPGVPSIGANGEAGEFAAPGTLIYCPAGAPAVSALTGYKVITLDRAQPGLFSVLTLPADVTEVDEAAFEGIRAGAVWLGSGVQTVGAGAFAGNDRLDFAVFENGDTQIGEGAFAGCPHVWFICAEDTQAAAYARANGIPVYTGSAWQTLLK